MSHLVSCIRSGEGAAELTSQDSRVARRQLTAPELAHERGRSSAERLLAAQGGKGGDQYLSRTLGGYSDRQKTCMAVRSELRQQRLRLRLSFRARDDDLAYGSASMIDGREQKA